ncbi:YbaK/EbsC family protein [Methylobacillus gramineus]|uniref:aminoacyl-tRNA deacylase n=1 Tax=Methylobacillus gramineus TaxID=755169 RepID=UPI001CFFD3D6|nr:YbaK/EbsC family protein [Methylobacillus gramineus]MCB5185557.1 YbaK/EbsC family protein [Methylobacillus gramineus]
MTTAFTSPVTDLLNRLAITFSVIEIPLSEDKKPVRNLEELLESQGLEPKSVVRSVVFRTGSEKFILLAVAGGGRADWALLRNHLDERKLRMAEYDEVPEATGYVVGAVPPIALPEGLKVMVDSSLGDYETVVIGSGILGYALALKSADLLRAFGDAEQGSFTKA